MIIRSKKIRSQVYFAIGIVGLPSDGGGGRGEHIPSSQHRLGEPSRAIPWRVARQHSPPPFHPAFNSVPDLALCLYLI